MTYPKMINTSYNDFSAKLYIQDEILPNLPTAEKLVEYTDDLYNYLGTSSALRIIRKFKKYKLRGSEYEDSNHIFTTCDNEPALWNFMQCYEGHNSDIKSTIETMNMPIAFAITKSEKAAGLIYTKYGKQKRENQFSSEGWKHCHILACAPRGQAFEELSIDQRMLRLLSPFNHFPFPSPRKFEMIKDYGENNEFINLVKYYIHTLHLKTDEQKVAFEKYLTLSGADFSFDTCPADFNISFKPRVAKFININTISKENKESNIDLENVTESYVSSDESNYSIPQMKKQKAIDDNINFSAFMKVLQDWLDYTDEETVSNSASKTNNTPWITYIENGKTYYLNADTTRGGVKEFLKQIENHGNNIQIISNSRGKKNKVVVNDCEKIKGFYLYIVQ